MIERAIPPVLMIWLSPGFPVGAFAYSHGLELAVDKGWITDRAGLEGWLAALIEQGSLRNDLILLSEAWQAAKACDAARLGACNALALALCPSAERHLETSTQGNAFVAAINAAWPHPRLDQFWPESTDHAYPAAVGAAVAAHDIALAPCLYAYALAFITNLASAAIRLSLIGQTDAQRVIAALLPRIDVASLEAETASLETLGGATMRADLASLLHETQYSRLFRS